MLAPARDRRYRDLASLFTEEVFVPIVSYADESGIHDVTGNLPGAEVAVVSGYVARQEQWDVFTPAWSAVLDRYGVEAFHMADLNREQRCEREDCTSPYHRWSAARVDAFVHELIPIARENTLFSVAAAVDVRAYDRIFPTGLKGYIQHPYHFCFQHFFRGLLQAFEQFRVPTSGERVECFFDRQEEFMPHAVAVFGEMSSALDAGDLFGGISFQSKIDYVPLQAADLLAGRARKIMTRLLKGEGKIPEAGWDNALMQRDNIVLRYADDEVLESTLRSLRARLYADPSLLREGDA